MMCITRHFVYSQLIQDHNKYHLILQKEEMQINILDNTIGHWYQPYLVLYNHHNSIRSTFSWEDHESIYSNNYTGWNFGVQYNDLSAII